MLDFAFTRIESQLPLSAITHGLRTHSTWVVSGLNEFESCLLNETKDPLPHCQRQKHSPVYGDFSDSAFGEVTLGR